MLRTVCQAALWIVVAMKAIWYAMALAFIGVEWQVLAFGGALVLIGASAWLFGKGNGAFGLGLAWAGFLLAIAVGYYGGVPPGPLTDRIHDQFRSHSADYAFLVLAHLQFWVLLKMAPGQIVTVDAG
jgi:hypothetical protein